MVLINAEQSPAERACTLVYEESHLPPNNWADPQMEAALFAAAHHIGPYGEPMNPYVFLFRALAGLYFTALYLGRGFGVAVAAHAGYDVLVGVT